MTKEERDGLASALQFEADRHRDIGPLSVTTIHEGVATQRAFRDAIRIVREHAVESHAAEVEQLKALLREVEWSGKTGIDLDPACPCCNQFDWFGHLPDCRLKAALG